MVNFFILYPRDLILIKFIKQYFLDRFNFLYNIKPFNMLKIKDYLKNKKCGLKIRLKNLILITT